MKILLVLLFSLSIIGVFPTAQAACWITCDSGTRSCHDLTPSGCKRAGDSLKYCGAAWAAGSCPFNAVDNLLSSPEAETLYENSDKNIVTYDKIDETKNDKKSN